jgi:hypothetical protein
MRLGSLLILSGSIMVSLPAFGQGVGYCGIGRTCSANSITITNVASPVQNTQTVANVNLFVSGTGNDSGACTTSGTGACLTIQGALRKLPLHIKHNVVVSVGAGNFAGFLFGGQEIESSGTLLVQGTLGAATLATAVDGGVAIQAGTISSATAGSTSPITGWATATVTGAGWVTSDLRGKWIRILTGPGIGQVRAISDNTQQTLTITGAWTTTPTSSSTFDIVVPATVITSSVSYSANLGGQGIALSASTSNAIVVFGGPIGGNTSTGIAGARRAIQWMKVASGSGSLLVSAAARVGLYGLWLDDTGGIAATGSFSDIAVQESVSTKATQTFIVGTNAGQVHVINCVVNGVATALQITSGARVSIQQSAFTGLTSAFINYNAGGPTTFGVVSSTITGNGSSIGFKKNGTNTIGASYWSIVTVSLSSFATAFDLQGPVIFDLIGVSGSSNTVGIALAKGAKAGVDSTSTITATTEVTLDGSATTLALMRAASPKVLPAVASPYGTAIFE